MSKTRLTTSKCRRCNGHGVKTAVKGHASKCPYRLCDCHRCQKVVSRRISSTKNRLKQTKEIIFIKMKCLTGNVRVHAVKKSEMNNLRSHNIVSILDKIPENDQPSTSETTFPIKSSSPLKNYSKHPSIFNPSKTSAFVPVSSSISSTSSTPLNSESNSIVAEVPLIKPIPIAPFMNLSPLFFPSFQTLPKTPITSFPFTIF